LGLLCAYFGLGVNFEGAMSLEVWMAILAVFGLLVGMMIVIHAIVGWFLNGD
jgi:hypothetical protein